MSEVYVSELNAFGEDFTVDDGKLADPEVMGKHTSVSFQEKIQDRCPQLIQLFAHLLGKQSMRRRIGTMRREKDTHYHRRSIFISYVFVHR